MKFCIVIHVHSLLFSDGFMELNDHTYFKSARIQPSCSHIHEVLDTAIDSRPSVPSLVRQYLKIH